MEFSKDELLKLYIAMSDSFDRNMGRVTEEFLILQDKIKQELTK